MKQSMAWLKKCHLSPHTESCVCGAQELALITKFREKHILKSSDDDRCRMCKKDPETIFHILGACDVLVKCEYFTRHNNICRYINYRRTTNLACGGTFFSTTPYSPYQLTNFFTWNNFGYYGAIQIAPPWRFLSFHF